MTHKTIAIPGQTTRFDNSPEINFRGGGNTSASVIVKYYASAVSSDNTILVGEITFSDVLEYRWIEHDAAYEEYSQHEHDYDFGLIEILDSLYIETMASRGGWRAHTGTRIRGQPESEVRHFRMGFDDWGTFDVIASRVAIVATTAAWVERSFNSEL